MTTLDRIRRTGRLTTARTLTSANAQPASTRSAWTLLDRGSLTGTEQRELFHNHGTDLELARADLERAGLAVTERLPTAGRSQLVTRLCDESDGSDPGPRDADLRSLRSLRAQVARERDS